MVQAEALVDERVLPDWYGRKFTIWVRIVQVDQRCAERFCHIVVAPLAVRGTLIDRLDDEQLARAGLAHGLAQRAHDLGMGDKALDWRHAGHRLGARPAGQVHLDRDTRPAPRALAWEPPSPRRQSAEWPRHSTASGIPRLRGLPRPRPWPGDSAGA